ncbi:MAG: hypothetical protein AB1629_06890 [Candidatus Omnitrophota bacterium]
MGKSYLWLRVLLVMFCIGNIVLGLMALLAGGLAVKAAALFYGANVALNPQINYIIRMLGAFVFTMGVLGGIAAYEPVKNKAVINVIILLLAIRVLQRLIFAKEIFETFGISSSRNLSNIIFFIAIALALFMLRPKSDNV